MADALVVEPLEGYSLAGARLVETCVACPTQYDVHLADGRTLYFRYRFAAWTLQLDGPSGPGIRGAMPDLEDRGPYDGSLTLGEVLDVLEDAVPLLLQRLGGEDEGEKQAGADGQRPEDHPVH